MVFDQGYPFDMNSPIGGTKRGDRLSDCQLTKIGNVTHLLHLFLLMSHVKFKTVGYSLLYRYLF